MGPARTGISSSISRLKTMAPGDNFMVECSTVWLAWAAVAMALSMTSPASPHIVVDLSAARALRCQRLFDANVHK